LKAKYGGIKGRDVKKKKEKDKEAEPSQYKKIVAQLTFENRVRSVLLLGLLRLLNYIL
jgi:hypothetical protein